VVIAALAAVRKGASSRHAIHLDRMPQFDYDHAAVASQLAIGREYDAAAMPAIS